MFFPVKRQSQATAHSDSTVWKGVLSMLLCAHWELFPLTLRVEGRAWKKHAFRCPLMTPSAPIDVCLCKQPDSFIRRPVVLNNDMQQLRMSMSFPVFVRSYSVLLWKPNAILKNLYPRRLLSFFFPSHSLPLFGCLHLLVEKSLSVQESQDSSPTLAAAARLSAMIHGKDRVFSNAMLVDQVSIVPPYTVVVGCISYTSHNK